MILEVLQEFSDRFNECLGVEFGDEPDDALYDACVGLAMHIEEVRRLASDGPPYQRQLPIEVEATKEWSRW